MPVLKKSLIIGIPDSGKTHFAGQLFGRAENGNFTLKLRHQPSDISIFKEILQSLSDGKSASHTSSAFHDAITLPLVSINGNEFDLVYPDYGGEQITNMVNTRKIPQYWQNAVRESTDWLLLIRSDRIERPIDTLSTLHKLAISSVESTPYKYNGLPENSEPFYIELFQMLMWVRERHTNETRNIIPNLKILLTCWDKISERKVSPESLFKDTLPLFNSFISCHWKRTCKIIGLSSTGRTLSEDEPDEEYQIKGPHNFGYWITHNGYKDADLTKILIPIQ